MIFKYKVFCKNNFINICTDSFSLNSFVLYVKILIYKWGLFLSSLLQSTKTVSQLQIHIHFRHQNMCILSYISVSTIKWNSYLTNHLTISTICKSEQINNCIYILKDIQQWKWAKHCYMKTRNESHKVVSKRNQIE